MEQNKGEYKIIPPEPNTVKGDGNPIPKNTDYPIKLARDNQSGDPDKVYAIQEERKIKMWIPDPDTLKAGQDWWGDFTNIADIPLGMYREMKITIK